MTFQLSPEEIGSPLWKKLKEHMQEKLDSYRRQNDGDKDPVATAKLRGRIAEAKRFLALENPSPGSTSSADD